MKVKDKKTGQVYSVGIAQSGLDYFCEETQKVERREKNDYILFDENDETFTHRTPETLEKDFEVIEGWNENAGF